MRVLVTEDDRRDRAGQGNAGDRDAGERHGVGGAAGTCTVLAEPTEACYTYVVNIVMASTESAASEQSS